MASDVKASSVTATGTVKSGRARIRGIHYRAGATAGTIVIKDGGASGTTVLTINTPAAVGGYDMQVPDRGILCATDIHATLTTADGLTVFYEG